MGLRLKLRLLCIGEKGYGICISKYYDFQHLSSWNIVPVDLNYAITW